MGKMKHFEDFGKSVEAIKREWAEINKYYREFYSIEEKKKPQNINEFLERKKNRKPFYKDKNKKPWE